MPESVDHRWTTPSVGTKGDFDLLQRYSYSPISDWWHNVYIEIWGPAICHAYPAVSITSKDFTRFQIFFRNPSVKLEIQCAFIYSPVNCICNIDFLWSIFPGTIFYSLSLMLFKESECSASAFRVQCLFYPTFLLLASSLSCCFSGKMCSSFPDIYSNRKLTDPYL